MTSAGPAVEPGGRETAPGSLATVQAFVNTRDLERRLDTFDTAEALGHWLGARELLPADECLCDPVDLFRGRAVREALRETLRRRTAPSRSGPATDGVSLTVRRVLESQALRSGLTFDADPAGTLLLVPRSGGLDAALGRLLALVARAQVDGSWQRLKVCADDRCQWVFWDASRNRSGRWCSMAVCGNRTKVRAHRARAAGQP